MRDSARAYADRISRLDKRIPILHPLWRRLWKVALMHALRQND
jgi:hypothetical protein